MISDDGAIVPEFGGRVAFQMPDIQNFAQFKNMKDVNGWVVGDDDSPLVINEGGQTLKVTMKDGERHLVATDNNGQVLFDGPVETEDQRKSLPNDLAEKLDKYKDQFEQVKEGNKNGNVNRIRIIKDR